MQRAVITFLYVSIWGQCLVFPLPRCCDLICQSSLAKLVRELVCLFIIVHFSTVYFKFCDFCVLRYTVFTHRQKRKGVFVLHVCWNGFFMKTYRGWVLVDTLFSETLYKVP